jgi:hypothetical protein
LPRHEKRKFLAVTDAGTYLLKFTGLGAEGHAKAARARALHAGGFTPFVVGFRHGFLIEQWREDVSAPDPARSDREKLIDALARYIAFRAEHLPAGSADGASLADLVRMAQVNAGEALGEAPARRIGQRIKTAAEAAGRTHPVHIDGRLHLWEWLETPAGHLLKTDAVDHSRQHDLIGCQDPAWDLAGAKLEFGLGAGEFESLLRRVARLLGGAPDPHLLTVFSACYPAFQLGLWSSDADLGPPERRSIAVHTQRYRDALLELAA